MARSADEVVASATHRDDERVGDRRTEHQRDQSGEHGGGRAEPDQAHDARRAQHGLDLEWQVIRVESRPTNRSSGRSTDRPGRYRNT